MEDRRKEELKADFLELIQREVVNFSKSVSTDRGDWVVKGFIPI